MTFQVGNLVKVLPPPSPDYFGISSLDWLMAKDNTYRIGSIGQYLDKFTLIDSPFCLNYGNGAIGKTWWWPNNCLELASRHPVEVF